jgi:adenylate cyclase
VLAYGAVVPFKGGSPSPDEVRRALNAAYLVEGSVRTAGQRVRVTARLTDAASGVQLWSNQFDADLREVFSVQDEITRRIASSLASRVRRIEREQAFAKPTQSLAAYDYLLRGRELMAMGTRAANFEARAIFERAVEQDPRYASAYAALAGPITRRRNRGGPSSPRMSSPRRSAWPVKRSSSMISAPRRTVCSPRFTAFAGSTMSH